MRVPLTFNLTNEFGEQVLFTPDGAQHLVLEVQNELNEDLTLAPNGDAAEHNVFHFQLLFRPQTLLEPSGIRLHRRDDDHADSALPADLEAALQEGTEWAMNVDLVGTDNKRLPLIRQADLRPDERQGFVWVSLLRKGELKLKPRERVALMLEQVRPDGGLGARPTQVEIRSRVKTSNGVLEGLQVRHLNVMNISRKKFLTQQAQLATPGAAPTALGGPFLATIVGSNVLMNDGLTQNRLRVRVINLKGPVKVRAASEFRFSWDLVTKDRPFGLDLVPLTLPGPSMELNHGQDFWKHDSVQRRVFRPVADGQADEWERDEFFEVEFTLFTTAPSGYATIRMDWLNFEGHDDGQVALLVQLNPLGSDQILNGDGLPMPTAVSTSKALRFWGGSAGLEFFKEPNRGVEEAAGRTPVPDARIRLTPDGGVSFENLQVGQPLRFSAPLEIRSGGKPALTITAEGNVGIGTAAPGFRLQIGDREMAGPVGLRLACAEASWTVTTSGEGNEQSLRIRKEGAEPSQSKNLLVIREGGAVSVSTLRCSGSSPEIDDASGKVTAGLTIGNFQDDSAALLFLNSRRSSTISLGRGSVAGSFDIVSASDRLEFRILTRAISVESRTALTINPMHGGCEMTRCVLPTKEGFWVISTEEEDLVFRFHLPAQGGLGLGQTNRRFKFGLAGAITADVP